jgi:hypothetical protein
MRQKITPNNNLNESIKKKKKSLDIKEEHIHSSTVRTNTKGKMM